LPRYAISHAAFITWSAAALHHSRCWCRSMSKRQREREIAEQADAARDQGRDHHKANIEALLAEAHLQAAE
jgi:hypothetical protein